MEGKKEEEKKKERKEGTDQGREGSGGTNVPVDVNNAQKLHTAQKERFIKI